MFGNKKNQGFVLDVKGATRFFTGDGRSIVLPSTGTTKINNKLSKKVVQELQKLEETVGQQALVTRLAKISAVAGDIAIFNLGVEETMRTFPAIYFNEETGNLRISYGPALPGEVAAQHIEEIDNEESN